MKWKVKKYNYGDQTIFTQFAWLPTEASNGYVYWLQRLDHHFKALKDNILYPSYYFPKDREWKWELTAVLPHTKTSEEV